jgi:phage-related minor tail protein
MASKRDTGARCDEAGKNKTINKINEILGDIKYTTENTKAQKATADEPARDAISHAELCVLEEILLRYFNKIKKNNKKWFLTPEMAIYYKLYTVNV